MCEQSFCEPRNTIELESQSKFDLQSCNQLVGQMSDLPPIAEATEDNDDNGDRAA